MVFIFYLCVFLLYKKEREREILSKYIVIYKIIIVMCKIEERYIKLRMCRIGGFFLNWEIKERFFEKFLRK